MSDTTTDISTNVGDHVGDQHHRLECQANQDPGQANGHCKMADKADPEQHQVHEVGRRRTEEESEVSQELPGAQRNTPWTMDMPREALL